MKSTGFILAAMLIGVCVAMQGQSGAAAQQKAPKKLPTTSMAESGAQLYKDHCAACHGTEGKGDGPVAGFLKAPPADLRVLAQRNNGKYPADYVSATLRSGTDSGAHGTSDMPIWGPVFRSRGKKVAELRIHNLTEFIESLQTKY
jgi:mono/diheme cytochrome c family protein